MHNMHIVPAPCMLEHPFHVSSPTCFASQTAGVPLGKIRGFRGPFLLHDIAQRDTLAAAGFLYDSTITSVGGWVGGWVRGWVTQ